MERNQRHALFAEDYVESPLQAVLHAPVTTHRMGAGLACAGWELLDAADGGVARDRPMLRRPARRGFSGGVRRSWVIQ